MDSHTRPGRWRVGLAVLCATCGLAVLSASLALAISAPIHIANTGGEGVNIRAAPIVSSAKLGWMPEGTSPDYNCFVWGERINGVPIWFNVNYGGATGYYASYYDDSSYHSNEELTAKYGVPLCGSPPPTPPPPPAPTPTPSGGLAFTIFNAEGGIYYRNSPGWADTSATPGVGVYDGDQVELMCGAPGDPVGPYNDTAWSKVKNLTRPSIGEGWVNEHFINDGAPADHWPAGERMCSSSTISNPGPGASSQHSAFYAPEGNPHGAGGIPQVADIDFMESDWAPGSCNPSAAGSRIGGSVNTLAGWSKGRLGPMYFLEANPTRWGQLHTIILFDPGNERNMNGFKACDGALSPSISTLLVQWLQDPANELLILTGYESEEHTLNIPLLKKGFGESHYHGLWDFYLKGLWAQPWSVRQRAQICDYNNLGHEAVLQDFYGIVGLAGNGARPSGCPVSPSAPAPTAWNP